MYKVLIRDQEGNETTCYFKAPSKEDAILISEEFGRFVKDNIGDNSDKDSSVFINLYFEGDEPYNKEESMGSWRLDIESIFDHEDLIRDSCGDPNCEHDWLEISSKTMEKLPDKIIVGDLEKCIICGILKEEIRTREIKYSF